MEKKKTQTTRARSAKSSVVDKETETRYYCVLTVMIGDGASIPPVVVDGSGALFSVARHSFEYGEHLWNRVRDEVMKKAGDYPMRFILETRTRKIQIAD